MQLRDVRLEYVFFSTYGSELSCPTGHRQRSARAASPHYAANGVPSHSVLDAQAVMKIVTYLSE